MKRTRHYKEVPEHWKAPLGPYVQAPTEYGGEWWFVNPFTGPAPWITEMPKKEWPAGFLDIFPEPRLEMFMNAPNPSAALAAARSDHISALTRFDGLVDFDIPEDPYLNYLADWDMSFPWLVYKRRDIGRMVAFFSTPLGTWHASLGGLLYNVDHTIAQYQVDLEQAGLHDKITKIHWLNPPDNPPRLPKP